MVEPTTSYAVRAPRPAEAPAIAHAHWLAWREAYRGVMPDDYLDSLTEERLVETWRLRLEVDEPDAVLLVGVAPDGEVLGFASAGPPLDDDAPTDWQLYAINLVRAAFGTGLAQDLVRVTVGERAAVLWVLEDNPRARAFYAKQGFVDEGSRQVHEPSGCMEMRLVRRPLTTEPLVGPRVALRLATAAECAAMAAHGPCDGPAPEGGRGPRMEDWAPEFPRQDDIDGAPVPAGGGEADRWGSRLIVRRSDGLVVGTAGFFGPPDDAGEVEVGYGLVEDARRTGLMAEALPLVVAGAFAAGATSVRAHTEPANAASRALLHRCGFADLGDDGSGEVLHRWVRPD